MKHTVTEHTFKNGAQGLVVDVLDSSVVNIIIRFNSGFQFADPLSYEIPHVTEHLIGCGTKKYPGSGDLKIEFQRNGAYRNAYTSSSVNGYVIECAAFELERILDLLEEYIAHPTFPEEALPTEISNVREELSRFTTQYPAVCSMALAEKTFPHENLNFDTRISQLESFTHKQVLSHYKATHTSANARFYIAGVQKDKQELTIRRIEEILDQLPRGERRALKEIPGRNQAEPIVVKQDIKQIYYNAELYAADCPDELKEALVLLRIVLTGGFQSRVYGEARRRGLAYHVSSGAYAGPGETNFGFEGYVTQANIGELFKLMAKEFNAVRSGNVSNAELSDAKDLVIGSSVRSHQTAGDMLGWYLGRYDREEVIRDFDEYHDQLRLVTPDQVTDVANFVARSKSHGMSLLGDIDVKSAQSYSEILSPMWK